MGIGGEGEPMDHSQSRVEKADGSLSIASMGGTACGRSLIDQSKQ